MANAQRSVNDMADEIKAYMDSELTSRDILNDTVGWTGKNLFKYDVPSGNSRTVTFTVNSDKTILVNGTPTEGGFSQFYLIRTTDNVILPAGKYIFSSGYSDDHVGLWLCTPTGATSAINIAILSSASEAEFTLENDTQIISYMTVDEGATANNVLVKPMIRRATEPAGYEPYHDSVKETLRDAEVIEGKNLLDVEYWMAGNNAYNITAKISGNDITFTGQNAPTAGYNGAYSIRRMIVGKDIQPGKYILYGKNSDAGIFVRADAISEQGTSLYFGTTNNENQYIPFEIVEESHGTPVQSISFSVWIGANTSTPINKTLSLMLCTEEDWNKSHEIKPFYTPVKDEKLDIINEQLKLGAWNLLPNTSSALSDYGVTYTPQSNGTVIINGKSTHDYSQFQVCGELHLPAGTYYLSAGMLLKNGVYLSVQKDNNSWVDVTNNNNEAKFTLAEGEYLKKARVAIANDVSVNYTLKPMISLKPHMPYAPYTMTNKELTERVTLTKIAEASANQTWAAQLSVLHTAFSALSAEEKTRCVISAGDNFEYGQYSLQGTRAEIFTINQLDGYGGYSAICLRLANQSAKKLQITSGLNMALDDLTNQTNSIKFILYKK